MKSLNIGDFIQCRDKNDMVDTMMELAENGYDTDFVYQRDGKKGYWLKVEDYTADTYQKAFKYALESFSLFAEELKYEYEDYEVDFEQAKDAEQQIAALQNMCICQGKMKMLYEVVHLMNNAHKEILEAEDDTSNSTDSANVS